MCRISGRGSKIVLDIVSAPLAHKGGWTFSKMGRKRGQIFFACARGGNPARGGKCEQGWAEKFSFSFMKNGGFSAKNGKILRPSAAFYNKITLNL